MAIKMTEQTVAKPAKAKPRAPQAPKTEVAKPVKAAKPARAAPKRVEAAPAKPSRGRPSSGMRVVTLRLDPDVIEALQKDGAGWGARANAVLRKGLGL
jgi:uncharacterized protein (DUF4415 family)